MIFYKLFTIEGYKAIHLLIFEVFPHFLIFVYLGLLKMKSSYISTSVLYYFMEYQTEQ